MAVQKGPTWFKNEDTSPQTSQPLAGQSEPRAGGTPHMRAALGSPLLITQEVSSGQGWGYENQTVGHPKGSHRRSFPFSAHALPEPEAFPIHSQDVGMMGQPVQPALFTRGMRTPSAGVFWEAEKAIMGPI